MNPSHMTVRIGLLITDTLPLIGPRSIRSCGDKGVGLGLGADPLGERKRSPRSPIAAEDVGEGRAGPARKIL